jgi:uncharacterized protein (DUF885 family)
MSFSRWLPIALLCTACAGPAVTPTADAPQATPASVAETSPAQKLFADFWQEYLALNPIEATYVGDPRYNDQMPNFLAPEEIARQHAFQQQWLDRISALDTSGLSPQDQLSVEIFKHDRREALEGDEFPGELIPINQFYNIAGLLAQLGSGTSAQPFATVQDYDNWLKRVDGVPALFEQAIANMREGVNKGVVQPRILMERSVDQLDALIADDPTQSLFYKPVASMPESFSAAERERLTAAYTAMVVHQINPSYRRLRDYIRSEYLPHARTTAGMGALPMGKAWYAYNVRSVTTTELTPEQIHQIGLDEVDRIHKEMKSVIAQVGFKGDLHAFFEFLKTDKRFEFDSEDALLAAYNSLREQVDAGVPKLFSVTPKAAFEIRPIEPFRAKSAAGGEYQSPSEDGSRPGIFYVNTYDLPTRKTWDMEDLYLHEAIPGHHFQLAIQQELEGVPAFRRFGGVTAFVEGWALYTESLGKELGVYQDPYSYFGYLQNELWRAIRLVVDTGLHAKGWTREQVIDYMLANSAQSKTQAVAEAERYMAIPGQALAYKIGELRIKALRAKAEKALGERFDIRDFHTQVLKDGAVPLDILEQKIDRWIAAQSAA